MARYYDITIDGDGGVLILESGATLTLGSGSSMAIKPAATLTVEGGGSISVLGSLFINQPAGGLYVNNWLYIQTTGRLSFSSGSKLTGTADLDTGLTLDGGDLNIGSTASLNVADGGSIDVLGAVNINAPTGMLNVNNSLFVNPTGHLYFVSGSKLSGTVILDTSLNIFSGTLNFSSGTKLTGTVNLDTGLTLSAGSLIVGGALAIAPYGHVSFSSLSWLDFGTLTWIQGTPSLGDGSTHSGTLTVQSNGDIRLYDTGGTLTVESSGHGDGIVLTGGSSAHMDLGVGSYIQTPAASSGYIKARQVSRAQFLVGTGTRDRSVIDGDTWMVENGELTGNIALNITDSFALAGEKVYISCYETNGYKVTVNGSWDLKYEVSNDRFHVTLIFNGTSWVRFQENFRP